MEGGGSQSTVTNFPRSIDLQRPLSLFPEPTPCSYKISGLCVCKWAVFWTSWVLDVL